MTSTQQTLINRAKANGGVLNLAAIAPAGHLSVLLKCAASIPADVAYVQSNCLIVVKEN